MGFVLNISLLLLGTAGALAAFGGDTWLREQRPLLRRITRRGWFALACMVATLALSIFKEVTVNAAAYRAIAAQAELESKLAESQRELASMKREILGGVAVATTGLRREVDFATAQLTGTEVQPLLSGRGGPLMLYGGDYAEYHVFCRGGRQELTVEPLFLVVGDENYRLTEEGSHMLLGPIGRPMRAAIANRPQLTSCLVKLLILSADRTRTERQLAPLLDPK